MSNNIDQENQPGNDDNTDRTKDIGENNYVRCTSCKVRSFFTYRGLNQHPRICLKKTRDVIVTDSQPASSANDLQSTTESQQRQNVREIVSEEYTNIKWGERNLREVSKMRMNVLSSGRKTYSCFQQVQLQKNI